MAKAEEKPQRALTPEETARRKAAVEAGHPTAKAEEADDRDDPTAKAADDRTASVRRPTPVAGDLTAPTVPAGRPPGYVQRLERAEAAVSPSQIDYDRDGYPDGIVGRDRRNLPQLVARANVDVARDAYALPPGTYRQDQTGYRARLRERIAAARQLADAEGDEAGLDPKVLAMAKMEVASHGGTGVPGGSPSIRHGIDSGPKPRKEPWKRKPTPTEQAIMAPRTARTGFANSGVMLGTKAADTDPAYVPRPSFGSVPVQGTVQDDGGFNVSPSTMAASPMAAKDKDKSKDDQDLPDASKAVPSKHEPRAESRPARPPEQHKPAEHHDKR